MPISRSISVLVHAESKVGKSTFAMTAPAPRLLLDVESAARFLPGVKVTWDPYLSAPPAADGTWDTCVVTVRDYSTFTQALSWLQSGQHEFASVLLDSISELQSRAKDQLAPTGDMERGLWGQLLIHMEKTVRALRDLTEHPVRPIQAVVITAMTEERGGKMRPYVQGALRTKLPYFLDLIGYMYVDAVPDPTNPANPPAKVRKMLTVPSEFYEAGGRTEGRIPEVIDNPTVSGILDGVFGES